eukprot:1156284-Pelagomonas_calceolata.AAC.10
MSSRHILSTVLLFPCSMCAFKHCASVSLLIVCIASTVLRLPCAMCVLQTLCFGFPAKCVYCKLCASASLRNVCVASLQSYILSTALAASPHNIYAPYRGNQTVPGSFCHAADQLLPKPITAPRWNHGSLLCADSLDAGLREEVVEGMYALILEFEVRVWSPSLPACCGRHAGYQPAQAGHGMPLIGPFLFCRGFGTRTPLWVVVLETRWNQAGTAGIQVGQGAQRLVQMHCTRLWEAFMTFKAPVSVL